MSELLTTADELHAAIRVGRYADGGPVRILDVRWRLDRPDGLPDYRNGHIPGAVYVDLSTQLSAHDDRPGEGRHPLPTAESLQASARSWGISAGDTVIVYDDLKNLSSARAWWLLHQAGVEDVRILDGSLRAWTGAGYELESGDAPGPAAGDVTLTYDALDRIDIDDVAAFATDHLLLDARAADRYRGEGDAIDPRSGHIPGATSAPTTENVGGDGRFLDADALRERFTALGAQPGDVVGVYCGSGVTATHQAVALTLAGFSPRVYPGSWSQWASHPELPIVQGPNPR